MSPLSWYAFVCHGCGRKIPRAGEIVHHMGKKFCSEKCSKKHSEENECSGRICLQQ